MKKQYTLLLLVASFIANSQCFTKIYAGEGHVVAIKSNNSIWSWGWNGWDQQGTGNIFDQYEPISLSSTSNWQFITSGWLNNFAIKSDGTLWGTGNNKYGALGINSTAFTANILSQIGTATNWKQVGAGGFFTVATKTDNTLWGWGQNNSYQMGNNSCCADRLAPG
ncbi:RCC1 domain-containing protein, partial [Flavobacterium sp.]